MKRQEICLSPAKINLILRVGPKRKDSYHEIASLMLKLPWGDRMSLEVSSSRETKISITCNRSDLQNDENLAVKAASLFSETFRLPFDLKIDIQKQIPMQGGLGGGSSNAATVLSFLSKCYRAEKKRSALLNERRLLRLGAKLGSDVPFFLGRTSAAWCTGRGEKLEELALRMWPMVLVFPQSTISTAWAYRELDRRKGKSRKFSREKPDWLRRKDLLIPVLENDFEALALEAFEELTRLKRDLMESGALTGQMTGSGSCFFGVYESNLAAERASRWLSDRGWKTNKVSMGE